MFKKNIYVAAVLFVALEGNLNAAREGIDRSMMATHSYDINGETNWEHDDYFQSEELNQKSNSPASGSPDENLTANRRALNFTF